MHWSLLLALAVTYLHPGVSPRRNMWGGHSWRAHGYRVEPQAGLRGRAAARESGQKAPKAGNRSKLWVPNGSSKFASLAVFFKLANQAPNVTDFRSATRPVKIHRICIKLSNSLAKVPAGHMWRFTAVYTGSIKATLHAMFSTHVGRSTG